MKGNANPFLGRPRSWWLWTAYWGLLFVIMHVPVPERALERVHVSDRVVHFAVYFILTGLGAYHLWKTYGRPLLPAATRWALVYMVYAALDEWLQRFVHRTPSIADWLADIAGITIATGIAVVLGRGSRPRLSEPDLGGG